MLTNIASFKLTPQISLGAMKPDLHLSKKEINNDFMTKSITFVSGLQGIVEIYSTFLLDMWGVMHDGSQPYNGALQTVKFLKEAGKKMIILSNSSKRKEKSLLMLQKLGFDPSDFDQIITSGEVRC